MGDSIQGSELDNVDYTKDEERRTVRKVDLLVLPCIILMFLHLQFVGPPIYCLSTFEVALTSTVGSNQFG